MRSGILESIHAFGVSKVGGPLLALIAVVVVGSAALIVSRLDDLRGERRIESLASREAVFLVNNLLLVALCAVIFWGTFFPLISEALTGEERSVGPPFFNAVTTPLAIVLVLFTGIGPLLAWRRVSAGRAWRLVWRAGAGGARGGRRARAAQRRRSPSRPRWCCSPSPPFALGGAGLGVRAGGVGAAGADAAAAAGRAGARGGPQPAPLRRLHRPRGHRDPVHRGRRLVELPDRPPTSASRPGESATVGDFEVTYVEPIGRRSTPPSSA